MCILSNGKQAPNQFEVINNFIKDKNNDIYHAHFGPVGETVQPAVAKLDLSFVASFYGVDISKAVKEDPTRYKALFQTADAVTALSEDMKERLVGIGCPESKIRKQPIGINIEDYPFHERTWTEGEPIKLLTVAWFVEKKGLSYAIDAIATLADEYPVEYRIIGDGPQREEIESQIKANNLSDTIELLGFREHEEMKKWMNQSHLFMLPSVTASDGDREGTPTVLLEAQATGLPVISTYHAGIPEIVADKDTGLLVPERDMEALAGALQQLIESSTSWPQMGRAGRKLVKENHSLPTVIDRLETLYESVE